MDEAELDRRLDRIARRPFRAKFHLRRPESDYLANRGRGVIREHAVAFVDRRLAPALPERDGRQTPWGGHPVFRAQHATGTCCRTCLAIEHGIAKGHTLSDRERAYVVDVICRWIDRDAGRADRGAR